MSGSLPPGNMETDAPQPVSPSAVPGPSGQLPPQQGVIQSLPGLTHSPSPSRASKPKSSSVVTRSDGADWSTTATLNNLRFFFGDTVRAKVDDVLQSLKAEIKYPRVLLETNFIEWVMEADGKRVRDFPESDASSVTWLRSIQAASFEGTGVDTYEAGLMRFALYRVWDGLLRTTFYAKYVEMEQRTAFDVILRIAFETRLKACQFYRGERELMLPSTPYIAVADAMVVTRLPDDWFTTLDLSDSYVFTSVGTQIENMITFIVEYKKASYLHAARQLALSLSSAQHSRRALGFGDGRLYGATFVGTIFTVHSAEWVNDQVVVSRTSTRFDVQTFNGFVDCYIFLSKLADHIAADAQRFFSRAETEEGKQKLREAQENATKRPWRLQEKPSDRKRPRTDDGGAGGHGGGEDEMDYQDWEPFEASYVPPGRTLLIERNLAALDKSNVIDLEMIHNPPAKNIRSWAEESLASGEHVM